jgi:mannose-6-phosphate isomerase-like protein (cupin superfamily)
MVKSTAIFPKPESLGFREWGTETRINESPGKWVAKLITMKRGAKGGLQYHRLKDEGGTMTKGTMLIRYDDGNGLVERTVRAGESFRFPPGCRHQAEAITACAYFEVSTPHYNDRVHVEADYGIETEAGGLPSTELSEVELR